MGENIKLKDLYDEEQSYTDIGTLAVPKEDGSGNTYYVQRPIINYTLQDPPAHEPAVTEGDFFVWNVGDGPLLGEYDDGNIVGVVSPPVEGKTTKPLLYISVSQPVSGVTVNASGYARLVYLYEELSGAVLKEVLDFNGTTDFTAEVGWGQLLLDDSGSVTGYAKITEPGSVVIGILQPMGILNADVFYAAFSEATQESQSVEVTENGSQTIVPTAGKSGIRKVALNVNVPSSGGNLQEKEVSITSNGTTEVTPDAGYDGMSKVKAVVNVAGGGGGVQANWAQNDSAAADYVKNRVGGFVTPDLPSKTYTFDGNLEGKEKVVVYSEEGEEFGFVKVSDDECWFSNIVGATMGVFQKGQGMRSVEINQPLVAPIMNTVMVGLDDPFVCAVNKENFAPFNLTQGIWFMYQMASSELALYVTSLTTVATEQGEGLQPIGGDLIHMPQAELYELYLYSNGGKKFKITVDDTGALKATAV